MMGSPFRTLTLFFEALAFSVLVPGTVVAWIPLWILGPIGRRFPSEWTALNGIALVPLALGVLIYLWCLRDFVVRGRGIPAPIDHPRRLVATGLYAHVRNPMYLGVLLVLLGEVVFFRSWPLFAYAAAWFLIVNGAVVLYEEPALRRKFGADYQRYASRVGRWIPRLSAGFPGSRVGRISVKSTFLGLVVVQGLHSLEEYLFSLWAVFPPARLVSGLVSADLELGFVVVNACLLGFGLACYWWPVRRGWPSAVPLAWLWVALELVNGIGHPAWSLLERRYTPGLVTALLLLPLALLLGRQLIQRKDRLPVAL